MKRIFVSDGKSIKVIKIKHSKDYLELREKKKRLNHKFSHLKP